MQFFIRAMITHVKMLATPSLVLALLLFPLTVFAVSFLGGGDTGKISIGLVYEETPLNIRVVERFQAYVGEDAEFILFSDSSQMESAAAGQRIECGYVLDSELKSTLYKSPLSVSHEVFNLMLSSALIETVSGELGAEVLKKYFPDEPELVEKIQAGADAYAAQGPAMEIKTVLVSQEGNVSEESNLNRQLHGLTALFAFLLSLFCAAFGNDSELPYRLRTVGNNRVFLYLLAQISVTFLLLLLFFVMSLRDVSVRNTMITFFFCLTLSCFSLFLSLHVKKDIIALIPFLFVATACFGQALFNIEEIAAFLKPFTRLTFTSYYMEGITKNLPWAESGALCLAALLSAGLSFGKVGNNTIKAHKK